MVFKNLYNSCALWTKVALALEGLSPGSRVEGQLAYTYTRVVGRAGRYADCPTAQHTWACQRTPVICKPSLKMPFLCLAAQPVEGGYFGPGASSL